MHLMGASTGGHELVIALSHQPLRAATWIHGGVYGEVSSVRFDSVSEEGGEWLAELAALRDGTTLRGDARLQHLDARALSVQDAMQDLQHRLRAVCGVRSLTPGSADAGCASQRAAATGDSDSCRNLACSLTCCRVSGRCVPSADANEVSGAVPQGSGVSEQGLEQMHDKLVHMQRSFVSRQMALDSSPAMRPGLSCSLCLAACDSRSAGRAKAPRRSTAIHNNWKCALLFPECMTECFPSAPPPVTDTRPQEPRRL